MWDLIVSVPDHCLSFYSKSQKLFYAYYILLFFFGQNQIICFTNFLGKIIFF